ncbi:unnamed protein product [Microthlaspi erraticum]|uniref:DUF223 domain-containing protein n=1 Tax=Microthlaspi erraticum TaxID=1685480 RepID=A0A6D2HFK8_9BRAS|nr:unnamed protein product [Microthlaspi erraticum]
MAMEIALPVSLCTQVKPFLRANYALPINLIGVVSYVGVLHTVRDEIFGARNKMKSKVNFRIRDLQNRELLCSASGKIVTDFYEMYHRIPNDVVVCELTDGIAISSKGWNHVVDEGGISRFEFDPRFPFAQELKDKFMISSQHLKSLSQTVNTAEAHFIAHNRNRIV